MYRTVRTHFGSRLSFAEIIESVTAQGMWYSVLTAVVIIAGLAQCCCRNRERKVPQTFYASGRPVDRAYDSGYFD